MLSHILDYASQTHTFPWRFLVMFSYHCSQYQGYTMLMKLVSESMVPSKIFLIEIYLNFFLAFEFWNYAPIYLCHDFFVIWNPGLMKYQCWMWYCLALYRPGYLGFSIFPRPISSRALSPNEKAARNLKVPHTNKGVWAL